MKLVLIRKSRKIYIISRFSEIPIENNKVICIKILPRIIKSSSKNVFVNL